MAFIIDDLLTLPLKGLWGIFETIKEMAEEEMNDTDLQKKLLELQLLYELGEITEEEFNKSEAEILNRLNELEKNSEQ